MDRLLPKPKRPTLKDIVITKLVYGMYLWVLTVMIMVTRDFFQGLFWTQVF